MNDDTERPAKRPSIRLSTDEAWAFVEASHTGIFTTLRRDGVPISLPVWFVVIDRRIYVTTPGGAKKVARVRHDGRAAFVVEAGERWVELKAVHLTGRARVVDDDDELAEQVRVASNAKYDAYRTVRTDMPKATQERYGGKGALIEFVVDERIVSWDNARLMAGRDPT
jgi:nitroimidazol reductase NimA-like FMN-containing flavoprotein (pyridoxamine 5'-phosphate oxidase superfamily)